ncbi:MAG: inner membrane CreD family protein [Anaerolineales bacterium]|nr:inner membrane CreD family protein [Anaerolineales bacterium]
MTVGRLIAVIFIFFCATLAWIVLGTTIVVRSDFGDTRLMQQVQTLWGSEHLQPAPTVKWMKTKDTPVFLDLDSSDIKVDLKLQQRRKGLYWYATYEVAFDGAYTFTNAFREDKAFTITFTFPSSCTIYDDFEFRVGDEYITPSGQLYGEVSTEVDVPAGATVPIHIAYKSRGLGEWRYSFADQITTVKNFKMTVTTDFDEYDFPEATISPSNKTKTPQGWILAWEFNNLVSDFDLGIKMPTKLNPGPLASRMSYFAPVSLLFFFTILIVLGAVKGQNLHPMHYFFLSAAFFSFHLLFSYLVDHLLVEISFLISTFVSLALVIAYLGRVQSWQFSLWAGLAQFLFLVLFSYAFFYEGYTGLVITIGAILTLAVMMQITAKVDWAEVFRKKEKTAV